MKEKRDYVAVKVAQFSWTRLAGADPFLGVGACFEGEVVECKCDVVVALAMRKPIALS